MLSSHLEDDDFLDDNKLHENLEDSVLKEAIEMGDYIKEAKNIASLHNQIEDCDGILMRMENMLLGFKTDLSSISQEIISLQQQSVDMNLKLKNRQSVHEELSQFVTDLVIPENMIKILMHTPVTDVDFLEQLKNLEKKINFLKEQSFSDARSCSDVKDTVEKLKIACITKIREFLLERINQFKKPLANNHIPQNMMLKFGFYYKFVMANNRDVAKEIKDEYVDTMSKVLFSYFKSYSGRLLKLQYGDLASREDLLGADDSKLGRFSGPSFIFSSKPNLKNKATVFSLGSRDDVLSSELEMPIIVPHHANQKKTIQNIHLSSYFEVNKSDTTPANEMFNAVMGRTFQHIIKQIDHYTQESYDCIALFLCIHLIYKYRILCHKRAVTAMDRYWDTVQGLFWSRLTRVFEMNVQSIRDCDPSRLKLLDLRPHYITRRYSEFSAAFICINDNFPDMEINRLLSQLQIEEDSLIIKMSLVFQQRREQLIFIINNYDVIISILSERINSDSKESDIFQEQMNIHISEYITLVLSPKFGAIINFLNEAEPLVENNKTDKLLQEEKRVLCIIEKFNSEWKKSLDDINSEVFASFPNLKNGTSILQQILTNFVHCRTNLINVHQLMVEVKKFKPHLFLISGILSPILNENYILTTGNCCHKVDSHYIQIGVGEHHLYQTDHEQFFKVKKMIVHENYDKITLKNDICLLKADRNIKFNSYVSTTKLPNLGLAFENETGIISENSGFCLGDSGGPLICDDFYQCGMISWNIKCGKKKLSRVIFDIDALLLLKIDLNKKKSWRENTYGKKNKVDEWKTQNRKKLEYRYFKMLKKEGIDNRMPI
ncbi:VPS52 [Lepeophtheirus salmonis]|uniref:Vacuolar protein sorting-associated protein 52 homolog n=1 Tax=Lepeophtheirus salmonis TaxID=72036 RepID=A0A7R8D6W7_LEPSM|nr:VPS52 [Lepeophtheirus salmonis]CAF3021678.1 VPS52 [Lepeophtheirus salmonis]